MRLDQRFEPASVASYAGQKRWFARRFPGCVVLLQKGWEYEVVDETGARCAASVGGASTPINGCSAAEAAPTNLTGRRVGAVHLPQLLAKLRKAGRATVVVAENGYLKRGLKRRVLHEISWSARRTLAGPTSTPSSGILHAS